MLLSNCAFYVNITRYYQAERLRKAFWCHCASFALQLLSRLKTQTNTILPRQRCGFTLTKAEQSGFLTVFVSFCFSKWRIHLYA